MFVFGQFNEFSDEVTLANPTIAVVAKAIELGRFQGMFYQAMGAPEMGLTTKRFDIYSRSQTSRNGIIGDGAAGGWDIDDVAALKMTAGAIKGLTVGHVLKVENEVVVVKSVNRAANTIDVYGRGEGSTTAAVHADEAAFKVIGFAGNDTDLKNVESVTETTGIYSNYVQTIFEVIDWTKHAELVRQGMKADNATIILTREAEIRVAIMLSTMAIHGVKQVAADDSKRYMSAGLLAQLADTNSAARNILSYNAGGALTEVKLFAAIKEIIDGGGNPDTIWVDTTNKGIINTFNSANSNLNVNTDRTDTTAGMYIGQVNYEGLIIPIRVDSDMPSDKLAIVKQGDCKKSWLAGDGLDMKDEPSASSREFKKSLQGSLGFIVENVGLNHSYIYGITH